MNNPPNAWIIAGLGNPGPEYYHTRHNIGFRVIDALCERLSGSLKIEKKFKGEIAPVHYQGIKLFLVKPLTYMNLSGECLFPLAQYYHIPPEQVLVLVDDVAIPFGILRIRGKGSAGGHNGLKSIIQHFGNVDAFPRLRIGIGAPQGTHLKQFVLDRFSTEEIPHLPKLIEACGSACLEVCTVGVDKTGSRYNGKLWVEFPPEEDAPPLSQRGS